MYFSHSNKTFVLFVFHVQVMKHVSYIREGRSHVFTIFLQSWQKQHVLIRLILFSRERTTLQSQNVHFNVYEVSTPSDSSIAIKEFCIAGTFELHYSTSGIYCDGSNPSISNKPNVLRRYCLAMGLSINRYVPKLSISENMKVSISFFFQA